LRGVFDSTLREVGRNVRNGALKLVLPTLLVVAGGLTGAVGLGFLTAWAYITLSTTVGQGPAALLIGLGLMLLAGGRLVMARKRLQTRDQEDLSLNQPIAGSSEVSDAASFMAFAAAFVLARYVVGGKRG
jgi:hypothetical protein